MQIELAVTLGISDETKFFLGKLVDQLVQAMAARGASPVKAMPDVDIDKLTDQGISDLVHAPAEPVPPPPAPAPPDPGLYDLAQFLLQNPELGSPCPPAAPVPDPPPDPAPPVAKPDATPSVPKPSSKGMWSPERDAIVREHYPDGMSLVRIAARCNNLPGPIVLPKNVSQRTSPLCVRRLTEPVSMVPPLPSLRPPPTAAERATETADHTAIVQWAGPRGLVFDGRNLDVVNKRRLSLGFIPFELERYQAARRASS